MNDTQARLTRCFAAVFPDLREEEIPSATPESVAGWDSLASITLMGVLEEEFRLDIPEDDLQHLLSFELVMQYVENAKDLC